MKCPADGMLVPTPAAMSGSRPMVTNSVVPMANPPSASATIARTAVRVDGNEETGVVATAGGALTAGANTRVGAGIPRSSARRGFRVESGTPGADGEGGLRGQPWPRRDAVRRARRDRAAPPRDEPVAVVGDPPGG